MSYAFEIPGQSPVKSPYNIDELQSYFGVEDLKVVSNSQFEKLIGYHILPLGEKLPIKLDSPLNDFNLTFLGRIIYKGILSVADKEYKKAEKLPDSSEKVLKKKNAIFLKRILHANSIQSLSVSSSGQFPLNVANALVAFSNGKIFKGVKYMIKKDKVAPLPKHMMDE